MRALRGLILISLFLQSLTWGVVQVPGSALPDTVSKTLSAPKGPMEPSPMPPLIKPESAAAKPISEEAKKLKFQLNQIIIDGNQAFSEQQLSIIYKKYIKQVITVNDLFVIVQDITNFYRNNGFIISRALLPPQHVKNGVVRIQILEGYLDKVDVTGKPKWAKCLLLDFARQISACRPLQLARMEKYLLLANEVPGAKVRAVLSPSKDKQGAADLSLLTEMKTFAGYFSYDNYGTRYIGPQQMTANLSVNSFARSGDMGQITMTKTPKGGQLTFIDTNYSLPIDEHGGRLMFGAMRAKTHPLFVLQPIQIDGLNQNYYANFTFPIVRERSRSLTLSVNLNYLDSEVNAFNNEQLYTDHLRNVGLGMTYNFMDRFLGSNNLYFGLRQGLPILGYTSNYNPSTALTSRPGGRADYTKFDLQYSRLQSIKGNFSFYGTFRAQYSFVPLLASEQFTFGGSQLGRGYDPAELIGDKGTAGSLELRYDWNTGKYIQNVQMYAFYDFGKIWNYQFISGTPRQLSATSTGLGARLFINKNLTANIMWGQPLTKEVAAEELIREGWRPRVFFSIVAMF